jgi:hypothetical protein
LRRSQSRIPLAVRDIDRFIDDNAAALGSTPTSQAQAQLNAARQSLDDHPKVQATRALAATASIEHHGGSRCAHSVPL